MTKLPQMYVEGIRSSPKKINYCQLNHLYDKIARINTLIAPFSPRVLPIPTTYFVYTHVTLEIRIDPPFVCK
jgi:hypothetical protein